MKQVLQNLKTGVTEVAEVQCPRAGRRQLPIRTTHTLVSLGTERMLVDFGRAGLIGKVRQQPDEVRMVLEKGRADGLAPALAAVRSKLLPLNWRRERLMPNAPWIESMKQCRLPSARIRDDQSAMTTEVTLCWPSTD